MISEATFMVSEAGNILVTCLPSGAEPSKPATADFRDGRFIMTQDGRVFLNVPVEDDDLAAVLASSRQAVSELIVSHASSDGIIFFSEVMWR